MIHTAEILNGHQTAEARWARFGPYYAMFPLNFAFDIVQKYSKEGDYIIDPFAGRSSSIFAGSVLGRKSIGIEINPVGWLYGKAKLKPAPKNKIVKRLLDIYLKRNRFSHSIANKSEFYRVCFNDEVLKFLLSARANLDWRRNDVDATLMAVIIACLHGKIGEGLSNQMKMTKAMGIEYSIKWWKNNGFSTPPPINPYDFLLKKIEWRFAKGVPKIYGDNKVIFGDSTKKIQRIVKNAESNNIRYSLLFTSPPYCAVTDYHADQWLRLWMLGGAEKPQYSKEKYKDRFINKEDYYNLLDTVFGACSQIMHKESVIYIRTDKRKFTFDTTFEILKKHFHDYQEKIIKRDVYKRTQTDILGNTSSERGEIDIVLSRKKISMWKGI